MKAAEMSTTDTPEFRLQTLGISLPEASSPLFNYIPTRLAGDLLFISGHGPRDEVGQYKSGKLGRDLTVEEGYEHAKLTGLHLLATAKAALGDLGRVKAVVKLLGMVNATPDFADHPLVINGCSDLLVDVFHERGRHARSAIGMGSLPNGMSVEIELILQVE